MSTVGREELVARLQAAIADARPVMVTGEAGIGKTSVLRAAVSPTENPRQVFEGGALATLSWIEHLCLRRALGRDVAGADAAAVAVDVAGAVGPGVLVLEDLHWAQPSTIDVVALLAGRIAVLASVRTGSADADRAVDALAQAGFDNLEVPPLDGDAARAVIRAVRPDGRPDDEQAVLRRAGGNPLLLTELAAQPEPPASLRLALGARLRALSADDRSAFELVALAGRGLPEAALDRDRVDALVRAGLLERNGEDVAVRHSLLGEIAAELIDPARRRTVHAQLARLTTNRGEAARHHEQAGELAEAKRAALEAAESAAHAVEAASHLHLAARLSSGAAADELRLQGALALESVHDLPGALELLVSIEGDDPQIRARAALLRARIAWMAGRPEEVRTAVAAGLALTAGTNSELEVRLRVEESRIHTFVESDLVSGIASATSALDLARSTGFAVDRAEYLLGTALFVADRPGAADHLARAIELARASGDTETELASNLISFQESAGSPPEARLLVEQMAARSAELGLTTWQAGFVMARTQLDFHAGELQASIDGADEVLALPIDARSRDYAIEVKAMDLVDLGRSDEVERLLAAWRPEVIDDYKSAGQLVWVRAEAALWGGHPRRALPLLETYLSGPEGDPNLVLGRITLAWARYECGLAQDPVIADQARPMLKAAVPESRALATLADDPSAAAAEFAAAAEAWAPYSRRGEFRCRWAQGEALLRAGHRTDALAVLRAVEADAEAQGHLMILGRVRRSLRTAGERRSAERTVDADGLTGREREVLTLVGQGLSNAQIATRLGVARRTVVALLESASAKLGATSRAQAAALANRPRTSAG